MSEDEEEKHNKDAFNALHDDQTDEYVRLGRLIAAPKFGFGNGELKKKDDSSTSNMSLDRNRKSGKLNKKRKLKKDVNIFTKRSRLDQKSYGIEEARSGFLDEVLGYEDSNLIRISDEAEDTSDGCEFENEQDYVGSQVKGLKTKPSPETQKTQSSREEYVTQKTDGSSNIIISNQGHCQTTSEMSSFQTFSEVSSQIMRSNTINEDENKNIIQTVTAATNANLQLLNEQTLTCNVTIQECSNVSVGNKSKIISLSGRDVQNDKCYCLRRNLEGESNSIIDRIANSNPLRRRGDEAALAKLQQYGIVLIVGPSGEGKTTMAMSLMDKIRKGAAMVTDKKTPIIARLPHHWHQTINIDEKIVVLIENIFGDYKFCDSWVSLIPSIIETTKKGNVSVIATTRTSIFLEAKPYLEHRIENKYTDFLSDKHTVDLLKQYPLTENEKKEALQSLFKEKQILPMTGEINAILKEDSSNLFGFHLISREYLKSANDKNRNPSFFSNPKPIIIDKIKELKENNPEKYFALVVCFLWPDHQLNKRLLYPGNTSVRLQKHISFVADICTLEPNRTLFSLRKALKLMSGFYIRETDSAYAIINSSVCKAIEITIRDEYPQTELQNVNEPMMLGMTGIDQSAETKERSC